MFKDGMTDIGDISPGQTVKVEWELDDSDPIPVHYVPDCGCTAECRQEGNKIVADFTESEVKDLSPEQKENWYPTGKMPITKGIWVYFKDDKDLWIIVNNEKVINENKTREKITFIGYVLLN